MNEEEIMGILRMIQERQSLILDILNRMEERQIEVKKEVVRDANAQTGLGESNGLDSTIF